MNKFAHAEDLPRISLVMIARWGKKDPNAVTGGEYSTASAPGNA